VEAPGADAAGDRGVVDRERDELRMGDDTALALRDYGDLSIRDAFTSHTEVKASQVANSPPVGLPIGGTGRVTGGLPRACGCHGAMRRRGARGCACATEATRDTVRRSS
jgi:hypothetical protein